MCHYYAITSRSNINHLPICMLKWQAICVCDEVKPFRKYGNTFKVKPFMKYGNTFKMTPLMKYGYTFKVKPLKYGNTFTPCLARLL